MVSAARLRQDLGFPVQVLLLLFQVGPLLLVASGLLGWRQRNFGNRLTRLLHDYHQQHDQRTHRADQDCQEGEQGHGCFVLAATSPHAALPDLDSLRTRNGRGDSACDSRAFSRLMAADRLITVSSSWCTTVRDAMLRSRDSCRPATWLIFSSVWSRASPCASARYLLLLHRVRISRQRFVEHLPMMFQSFTHQLFLT